MYKRQRRDHATKLAAALEGSPIIPPAIPEGDEHVFHLFVVRCSQRNELKHFLEEKGIQTGIHYPVPLHLTGAYQTLGAPGRGVNTGYGNAGWRDSVSADVCRTCR